MYRRRQSGSRETPPAPAPCCVLGRVGTSVFDARVGSGSETRSCFYLPAVYFPIVYFGVV